MIPSERLIPHSPPHPKRKDSIISTILTSPAINNPPVHWILGHIVAPIEYGIRDVVRGDRWGTTLHAGRLDIADNWRRMEPMLQEQQRLRKDEIMNRQQMLLMQPTEPLPTPVTRRQEIPLRGIKHEVGPPDKWLFTILQGPTRVFVTLPHESTSGKGKVWIQGASGKIGCYVEWCQLEKGKQKIPALSLVNLFPDASYIENVIIPLNQDAAYGFSQSRENPAGPEQLFTPDKQGVIQLTKYLAQALHCQDQTGITQREEEAKEFARDMALQLEQWGYGRKPLAKSALRFNPHDNTLHQDGAHTTHFLLADPNNVHSALTIIQNGRPLYTISPEGRVTCQQTMPPDIARMDISLLHEALAIAPSSYSHPIQEFLRHRLSLALGEAYKRSLGATFINPLIYKHLLDEIDADVLSYFPVFDWEDKYDTRPSPSQPLHAIKYKVSPPVFSSIQ